MEYKTVMISYKLLFINKSDLVRIKLICHTISS